MSVAVIHPAFQTLLSEFRLAFPGRIRLCVAEVLPSYVLAIVPP